MTKVTGNAPIGTLPTDGGMHGLVGLAIWECEACKALINDVSGHVCPAPDLTTIPEPGAPDVSASARLAAYLAADLAMRSTIVGHRDHGLTYGQIVDRTTKLVAESVAARNLSMDLASWEHDFG